MSQGERKDHSALPVIDAPSTKEPKGALLTTGDMARLSGSTLRTVRFYEQEGLIHPQSRSDGGRRQFTTSELERLQLALDLREAGLSLTDIKSLFELKRKHPNPAAASSDISSLLNDQLEVMQQKIAKLRRLREELVTMVAVISECGACSGQQFPNCGNCDVMDQPKLPRAVRVLWS